MGEVPLYQSHARLLEEVARFETELLHRNVQRFRGGRVFKAHRLCVSLNSRLESNKEEEEGTSAALSQVGIRATPEGMHIY